MYREVDKVVLCQTCKHINSDGGACSRGSDFAAELCLYHDREYDIDYVNYKGTRYRKLLSQCEYKYWEPCWEEDFIEKEDFHV